MTTAAGGLTPIEPTDFNAKLQALTAKTKSGTLKGHLVCKEGDSGVELAVTSSIIKSFVLWFWGGSPSNAVKNETIAFIAKNRDLITGGEGGNIERVVELAKRAGLIYDEDSFTDYASLKAGIIDITKGYEGDIARHEKSAQKAKPAAANAPAPNAGSAPPPASLFISLPDRFEDIIDKDGKTQKFTIKTMRSDVGDIQEHTFDGQNRLVKDKMTSSFGDVRERTYDDQGKLINDKMTFGNGIVHEGTFDDEKGVLTEGTKTYPEKSKPRNKDGSYPIAHKLTGKLDESGKLYKPGKFNEHGRLIEGRAESADGTIYEGTFAASRPNVGGGHDEQPGGLIKGKKTKDGIVESGIFDPMTGELIKSGTFDPMTGKLIDGTGTDSTGVVTEISPRPKNKA